MHTCVCVCVILRIPTHVILASGYGYVGEIKMYIDVSGDWCLHKLCYFVVFIIMHFITFHRHEFPILGNTC